MSRGDRESFRQAQAQIEAARATAFQQNMRTILESVWGQVATRSFATATPIPAYPGELPPKPKPTVTPKPLPILGEYADLGLQLDGRLEFRGEKNQSALCSSAVFFDPVANCRSAFEPLVDFQFAAKSGGIVADRVHVNLDYDTQREFDASNNISIYYEGKGSEFIQKLEVGNVTFQPPASRYITAGIPSGNYGIQAVTKLGSMRFKAILAQQKGNVVSDRVFTVGDRTLQAIDRKIEDYQFESRRFFFTVDPKVFGSAYPNIDILNTTRMRGVLGGFQPLDINFNRSLLSVYDGSAVAGSIAYQFGVGGINAFRSLGDELATAAGLVTQFSVNQTINLPFGANLAGRYQRINTRNWTRRIDQGQEVVDGTQIVFPDIAFRWAGRPVGFESLISNIGVNARVLETRQSAGTQLVGNEPVDDRGQIRVRTYPLNGTLVFAGERPLSTNIGYSFSKQLDVKPGLNSDGDNSDFSVDVAKPWKLPADWNARSDLRTRISYQRSQGRNFVFNPLALDLESRLTDNGRHAFSMSADTDVAENLSSSFVISRVESFDHNLNRRFTQTVLSAVMHLQFYAGDFK